MKKAFFKSTGLVLLFLILFTACNPDDINNLLITRDNYLGPWSVSDQPKAKHNYISIITADPGNSSQIFIYNFLLYGETQKVYGVVSGKNLTIGYQTVLSETINGDGVLQNGVLKITFYVNNGADSIKTHIATYTK